LDLLVVRRDAAADEPERRREPVEEVHLDDEGVLLEEGVGGVEPGGAGPDDGDAEGVVGGSDGGHGVRWQVAGAGGPSIRTRADSSVPQARKLRCRAYRVSVTCC